MRRKRKLKEPARYSKRRVAGPVSFLEHRVEPVGAHEATASPRRLARRALAGGKVGGE